ncbi:MAG: hypothetical protein AVO38_08335 [delta proteobacterium ML8_D]|nr:MAG: hypothetical protein AVO38_08335 [delta proteobacterium ML8_D]
MGKRDRKLERWKNNPPIDAPVDDVKAMVRFFFPGSEKPRQSGSHNIVIKHERLKGLRDYGPLGRLMIPVSGGQKVKGCYLQLLALAIEIISEDQNGGR